MARKRGIRFSGKSLELGRKYMWRDEFVPLLHKYLEIHPGQRIVDVGCGTGFLSRLVARALHGEGMVIGIDRNERLFRFARDATREAGLDPIVSFRKGDANALPLKDNFADRVICQTLLWAMRDPKKAIREMIRVCKPGGLVG
jgi:ubiquinone/menaquinone biosynthesis C-methylase UbiE